MLFFYDNELLVSNVARASGSSYHVCVRVVLSIERLYIYMDLYTRPAVSGYGDKVLLEDDRNRRD